MMAPACVALAVLADAASLPGGRYELSVNAPTEATRQRAIDTAVADFFVLARPFARAKLEGITRVSGWIDVAWTDAELRVHFEGKGVMRARTGTPTTWLSPEQEEVNITLEQQSDAWVMRLTSAAGTRTNRFVAGADGTLLLDVEIRSTRLQNPLRYSHTYRRRAPTPRTPRR